jgi:hypothetical protein
LLSEEWASYDLPMLRDRDIRIYLAIWLALLLATTLPVSVRLAIVVVGAYVVLVLLGYLLLRSSESE